MFSRREMLRSAALASLSMPFVARGSFAQEAWPAREIHAICGFPPGTGADIFVRHYARKLQEVSGKSVIVENKTGAFGAIATEYVAKSKPVFPQRQDASANETAVFRVSTEMWTIEYQERGGATIIRRPDGSSLPARGRFWIDPTNGSVLISELIVDGGGVNATVTVSYQSEPLMGFLVPVEMRESYARSGERITGHAQYGKFRRINE